MNDSQLIEALEYWNFWSQDRRTGVYRKDYAQELYRQRKLKEVSIVAGVRRAGKSTILLQVLKKLIDAGVPRENILYVNFEEPTFIPYLTVEFLLRIHDLYLERFNPGGRTYVVLDEVQLVPGWERFVRGLYDREKDIKFYITGSSSKLLSREYGASLTGRIVSNEVGERLSGFAQPFQSIYSLWWFPSGGFDGRRKGQYANPERLLHRRDRKGHYSAIQG
jgi:predicted AAA+ superfamily ATPase